MALCWPDQVAARLCRRDVSDDRIVVDIDNCAIDRVAVGNTLQICIEDIGYIAVLEHKYLAAVANECTWAVHRAALTIWIFNSDLAASLWCP